MEKKLDTAVKNCIRGIINSQINLGTPKSEWKNFVPKEDIECVDGSRGEYKYKFDKHSRFVFSYIPESNSGMVRWYTVPNHRKENGNSRLIETRTFRIRD